MDHVHKAFSLSGVDSNGLDALEQSYLKMFSEVKTLRLNIIASRLGLPAKTIQDVIESYLVHEEFITKEGSERVITEKGLNHIKSAS
jgi:Holliday junction resolvasome RuvABC ATP-dependent DNA helicase subunit